MTEEQIKLLKGYFESINMDASLIEQKMREIEQTVKQVGTNSKYFSDILSLAKQKIDEADDSFTSLSQTLTNVVRDMNKYSSISRDVNKSYNKLDSLVKKFKYDQQGIYNLGLKELKSLKNKIEIEQENLKALHDELALKKRLGSISDEEIVKLNELNGLFNDQNNYIKRILDQTDKRIKKEKEINQTLGLTGKIVDGIVNSLSKLGISSSFFDDLKDNMRQAAESGSKWKVVTTATKGLIKGIGEALRDPLTQLTFLFKIANFFFKAALNANQQIVQLGKSLGTSSEQYRENLVRIESSSSNLNVNSKNLVGAFNELVTSTGYVSEFSADALETQIMLTKQFGLEADAAANVYRFSVLTGKSSKEVNNAMLGAFAATRNNLKAGVPFKAAMAEAAKVSGILASNLQNNPKLIVEAVVQARALGTSLEQTASQGEKLLDFGSSINSELQAELLTGRELNLERARAAALAGDQVILAEELAKNVGSVEEFDRMNVLQKKALAEAVGLTSDELAKQLQNQKIAQTTGKSLSQVTKEQLADEQKRQDIQTKFNAAMEKIQSIIGNLLAGPLGMFIDSLSNGLTYVVKMFGYFGKIFSLIKSIPGVGPLLGGIASAVTIASLMTLVVKSLTKGTVLNPMVTRDISSIGGGGGGLFDMFSGGGGKGKTAWGGKPGKIPKGFKFPKKTGMIGKAGKFLGKASIASILGGFALDYGAEKAAEAGNEDLAKGLGVGSAALSGAGIGAMIGSIIPGVGTAIGAGVGGTIGALGALLGGSDNAQQVEDGIAPSSKGPFTVIDSYGGIGRTTKGDGLMATPNTDNTGASSMIAAINEVRDAVNRLYNKDIIVKVDSKVVATEASKKSYKSR